MSAAAEMDQPHAAGRAVGQPALRVMAFLCDDISRQAVARIAADSGWRQALIEGGGIGAAIEYLGTSASPDLLFVDLSESTNALVEINALADVCDPGTRVVAFGTANDVKLYRGLVAAGVVDYLLKPFSPADVLRAVSEGAGGNAEARAADHGKLCIVTGARGGAGASTVATSLAWLAAERYAARTALLDLDLRFGTGALTFDAEPGTGLAEMLADPDRIDTLFLDRASVAAGERLALFAAEAPLGASAHPRADAVKVLAAELLRTYAWVVVDLPRDVLADQPDLLSLADTIVVVTDLSLAGMRDAMRLRVFASEHGPRARLRVVLNETRPPSKGDLSRADFEKTLGLSFAAAVPLDRKAAGDSDGRGRPIAAGRGKAAAAIAGLGQALFSPVDRSAKKRPSLWPFSSQKA